MRLIVLVELSLLLLALTASPSGTPSTSASALSPPQQPPATSNYITAFKLAANNLSLEPITVYPTPTVVWLFAQSLSPPYYSQILAFKPTPQPRFTANVSLTNTFVSSSIAVDPKGRVWYGANATLAYYDPSTGKNQTVANFPGGSLGYLTVDNQDRIWTTFVGPNKIGFYDPSMPGSTPTTYPVPTLAPSLQGITAAPDGTIWFAEASARKLGRFNPTTSTITEYTAPQDVASPYQLAVDSKGVVWFSDHASSDFGNFNPTTGEWVKIPVGYCLGDCPIALPNAIAFDNNGNLWFSEHLRGVIAKYSSVSNLLTEYTLPLPSANTLPFPGTWWTWPGPGNLVWFVDQDYKEIGYVNASTPIPLTISSETTAAAFQGEQSTISVTVNYQGQGSVSLGVSPTSFDTRNLQITGQAQTLAPPTYPTHVSATFSVALGASIQPRYVTVTAQDGQVAVSISVRLTVLRGLTAYLTIGVAIGLAGTAAFLFLRRRRSLGREENANANNEPLNEN